MATSKQLDIIINAKDKASQTFENVGNGAEKAESKFGKFSKSMKAFVVPAAAAAAAVVAIGTAAFAFTKKIANAGDEFQKMSLRTGATVEALSSLKHVADLTGVSMGDLEGGLQRLSRNANEARKGTGQAADAFARLGISVEDSSGNLKTAESLMLEASDALAGMENETEATALTMDIFGRSGAALLPMLKEGSAGIKEMQEEARRLGITWTQETADAAAKFNDQLTRLGAAAGGLGKSIGTALIPPLTSAVTAVLDFLDKMGGFGGAFNAAKERIVDFGKAFVNTIVRLFTDFAYLKEFLVNIAKVWWETQKTFVLLMGKLGEIVIKFAVVLFTPFVKAGQWAWDQIKYYAETAANALVEGVIWSLNKLIGAFNVVGDKVGLGIKKIDFTPITVEAPAAFSERWSESGAIMGELLKEIGGDFVEMKDIAVDGGSKILDRYTTMFDQIMENGEKAAGGMTVYFDDWGTATELVFDDWGTATELVFGDVGETADTTFKDMEKAAGVAVGGMNVYFDDWGDDVEETSTDTTRSIKKSFSGAWRDILKGAEDGFEGIKDAAVSTAERIAKDFGPGGIAYVAMVKFREVVNDALREFGSYLPGGKQWTDPGSGEYVKEKPGKAEVPGGYDLDVLDPFGPGSRWIATPWGWGLFPQSGVGFGHGRSSPNVPVTGGIGMSGVSANVPQTGAGGGFISPQMAAFNETISGELDAFRTWADSIRGNVVVVEEITQAVQNVTGVMTSEQEALQKWYDSIHSSGEAVEEHTEVINNITGIMTPEQEVLRDWYDAVHGVTDAVEEETAAIANVTGIMTPEQEALRSWYDAVQVVTEATNNVTGIMTGEQEALRSWYDAVHFVVDAVEDETAAIANITGIMTGEQEALRSWFDAIHGDDDAITAVTHFITGSMTGEQGALSKWHSAITASAAAADVLTASTLHAAGSLVTGGSPEQRALMDWYKMLRDRARPDDPDMPDLPDIDVPVLPPDVDIDVPVLPPDVDEPDEAKVPIDLDEPEPSPGYGGGGYYGGGGGYSGGSITPPQTVHIKFNIYAFDNTNMAETVQEKIVPVLLDFSRAGWDVVNVAGVEGI